jgi:hypothetical protein
LTQLRTILDKVEKCCSALDRKLNLAEILEDPANLKSLGELFGDDGLMTGIQLILKLALTDYRSGSFITNQDIEGKKRLDFLYHSVGGWKQFDLVVCFLNTTTRFPKKGLEFRSIQLVNPRKKEHWQMFEQIPAGTLVTVYLKTAQGKRSFSQEDLAVERFKAIFDIVQSRNDLEEELALPTAVIHPSHPHSAPVHSAHAHPARAASSSKGTAASKTNSAPVQNVFARNKKTAASAGPLSLSFQVTINKIDTFVHAGNAHLITTHLQNYSGKVEMFVLRGGNKTPLALDPDSIWSAEVRNGETVVYDFYGPKPSDDFVKELGGKTNKYTQMDKMAE